MRDIPLSVIGLLVGMIPCAAFADCVLTETTGARFSGLKNSPGQIATIRVDCESGCRIGLDAGVWSAGIRRLHDGKGNFISYRLWQESAATQEWGDNGFSVTTYAAPPLSTAGGGAGTYHVFGSLSEMINTPPGEYSDTVRVILACPPSSTEIQQTATMSVSFHVIESCSLDVSGIHGFGTWPTGGTNPSGVALGSVSVTCSPGIHYALGLDAGRHYDGRRRQLHSTASNAIAYMLRADSSNGNEWGDRGLNAIASDYVETYPAQAMQADGNGQSQNFFVWGDADIAHAPAGIYADVVNVTIVW